MLTSTNWIDYELLDAGSGEKLERWGEYILRRPDPEAIWPKTLSEAEWKKADGTYNRIEGGGKWKWKNGMPEKWQIKFGDLNFWIKPTGFKHTGLFPEQAVHWSWLASQLGEREKVKGKSNDEQFHATTSDLRTPNVLNLFAYTGAATVASAKAGAKVTHVDSSKGIVTWAKENLELNGLGESSRLIVDDVFKFLAREEKRGTKYDGIIMDPPVFGRGTENETWRIEKMLYPLVLQCVRLLSPDPLFFLVNSYVAGVSPTALQNVLTKALGNKGGKIESDELGIPIKGSELALPAGVFARWSK
jgi:23S rRNA (cytosine1962-C5)-methyltransferase